MPAQNAMPTTRPLVMLAAAALAGCVVAPQVRIEDAPMSPASRDSLRGYFAIDERPKAFAFAPATGASWHAWGYRSVQEAQAVALKKCEEMGSPCEIYAINNVIVWRK